MSKGLNACPAVQTFLYNWLALLGKVLERSPVVLCTTNIVWRNHANMEMSWQQWLLRLLYGYFLSVLRITPGFCLKIIWWRHCMHRYPNLSIFCWCFSFVCSPQGCEVSHGPHVGIPRSHEGNFLHIPSYDCYGQRPSKDWETPEFWPHKGSCLVTWWRKEKVVKGTWPLLSSIWGQTQKSGFSGLFSFLLSFQVNQCSIHLHISITPFLVPF